jgi:hypothetical protein
MKIKSPIGFLALWSAFVAVAPLATRGLVSCMLVAATITMPCPAFAKHAMTADGVSIGWDPFDPGNQADVRSFVAAHWDSLWHADSTGAWPLSEADIRSHFRNPLPGDFGIVYLRWERVFRSLYGHRLSNAGGDAYDLWDLMRDDEGVRSEFKEFVLHGKIAPAVTNCEAFYSHYTMLVQAESGLGQVQAEDMRINEEGELESLELMVGDEFSDSLGPLASDPSAATPVVAAPSPANERKLCDVIWWSRASLLACMYGEGLWQTDDGPAWFDCDDFMLAMRNWLRRKMGQDIVRPFLFRWRCPGETKYRGHWMPVVVIGGKHYLINPYTGKVDGPYDRSPAGLREMAKRGILTVEAGCRDAFGNPVEPEWDEEPRFFNRPNDVPPKGREPRPPFWMNPDSLAHFCEKLAACCGRIPGGGQQSPACGPPPTGAEDDAIDLDPCDASNYLPEPAPAVTWPADQACHQLPPN